MTDFSARGKSSRRRGYEYQRQVINWLRTKNRLVRNLGTTGVKGTDLLVDGFMSVECKNHKEMDLAGWLDQACRDCRPEEIPVVFHKRRMTTDVGEHYATMKVSDLLRLVDLVLARRGDAVPTEGADEPG